jgi:hypothetical protein
MKVLSLMKVVCQVFEKNVSYLLQVDKDGQNLGSDFGFLKSL